MAGWFCEEVEKFDPTGDVLSKQLQAVAPFKEANSLLAELPVLIEEEVPFDVPVVPEVEPSQYDYIERDLGEVLLDLNDVTLSEVSLGAIVIRQEK